MEESEYSDIRLHYFGGGQNLTLNPPVSTPSKSLSALKYQAEVTKFTGRSQELQYLQVPKIVSKLVSEISTLYSNAIRTNFESAQNYFNLAVETCRYFSKKNIGDEKLHLGGLLKGSFEHYLKTEDFKSLCNLCDKTSELQQFEFVDTNHFLLNAPSTMLSSYQAAVRIKNKFLAKNIASTAKYWLDNLYDNKFIEGIYTHIVNDHRSIEKMKG